MIHGDYNFRNLVFDPATRQVKAVLDWEMAGIGDALCDLAEFLLCLVKPADYGYRISLPNSFQLSKWYTCSFTSLLVLPSCRD